MSGYRLGPVVAFLTTSIVNDLAFLWIVETLRSVDRMLGADLIEVKDESKEGTIH